MTLPEILISVATGIAANFLTPAVRTGAARLAVYSALKLRSSGRKAVEVRLRQLQEESATIESLHVHPIDLANRIACYMMPQVFSLWIITVAFLYVLFSDTGTTLVHSPWSGVVFGIIGYATRYPIGTLFVLSELRKVTDIDNFREKNSANQAKMKIFLDNRQIGKA